MDNATINIILTLLLTTIVAIIGFFLKNSFQRLEKLEDELNAHKIDDASKWSEFAAHKNEVMRRLDSIDDKLDKLLER